MFEKKYRRVWEGISKVSHKNPPQQSFRLLATVQSKQLISIQVVVVEAGGVFVQKW